MKSARKPRNPKAKPRRAAAAPPPTEPKIFGFDDQGNPLTSDDIQTISDELDEADESDDNSLATPAGDNTGIPVSFTVEEFNKTRLDLNKKINIEWIRSNTGSPIYMIIGRKSLKQVLAYIALKRAHPAHEFQGAKYAARAAAYITDAGGCFLLGADDTYHIILKGRRIPIDGESRAFQVFFRDACGITTLSFEAKMAIQYLGISAYEQASKMVMRGFSAMYHSMGGWNNDGRVYLPISEEGKILCITPAEISIVSNGNNRDQVWLEHPAGTPFAWTKPRDIDDVRDGLRLFEELIVLPQACEVPEMRWLVGMAEGIFPIVRDVTENRFLMLHQGKQGHGKTFGAKQSVLLHGFSNVKFDSSVAALDNSSEQGTIVVDNKENVNFSTELVDFLLRMATGGDRERSDQSRNVHRSGPRPVVTVTSIDGVPKAELQDRIVPVQYKLSDDTKRIDQDVYQDAITKNPHNRSRIMSAIACVVQDYLYVREDPQVKEWLESFRPIDRFNRHFYEVCYLLVAYARIMRRTDDYDYRAADDWAMEQIQVWDREIRRARGASGEGVAAVNTTVNVSSYEDPILQLIRENKGDSRLYADWEYPKNSGRRGQMYAFITAALHGALIREKLPNLDIPKEVSQFGSRIRNEHFLRFKLLSESDGVPGHNRGQRIGVWIPADAPEQPMQPA